MSVKTVLTNAKVEVENFNGTDNFSMWQCEIISNKGDKGNDTKKKLCGLANCLHAWEGEFKFPLI